MSYGKERAGHNKDDVLTSFLGRFEMCLGQFLLYFLGHYIVLAHFVERWSCVLWRCEQKYVFTTKNTKMLWWCKVRPSICSFPDCYEYFGNLNCGFDAIYFCRCIKPVNSWWTKTCCCMWSVPDLSVYFLLIYVALYMRYCGTEVWLEMSEGVNLFEPWTCCCLFLVASWYQHFVHWCFLSTRRCDVLGTSFVAKHNKNCRYNDSIAAHSFCTCSFVGFAPRCYYATIFSEVQRWQL